MDFKILGPVQIWVGQQMYTLDAPKQWCVLVSLLMAAGAPVPNEVLVDRLWGERPPAKASGDLRAYVSRLGRRLREIADDETHLVAQSHGYMLVTDPQSLDLNKFRLFVRQADSMALSGDDERAISLLQAGEKLWRGQALAGLSTDWIYRMRATLEEERRLAIAKRIDLQLHLGHHTALIGELWRLTDQYPLDEGFISQLMIALYRSGRQADALRVYREARGQLAGQGIEPNPALSKLHQDILCHDPQLAITPAFRRPDREHQPNTLPSDIEDFVGRSHEIEQVVQQSERGNGPLVQMIEGMPGVGKTTLAVRIAYRMAIRYPDAQLFLDFSGHSPQRAPLSSIDALYRLLRMLEVPAARIPNDLIQRANLWQAELAHRRVVIVLDDVRELEEIRPILPVAGDSLSIVTSRRRHMHGPGGPQSQILDVLPDGDAIQLFSLVSGWQADDADQMTRAVRLCGCLPLAIRVSASWLRHGNLPGLTELLDDLSNWVGQHDLTGELGQHIMPVFEVSYRGLTRNQRQLFRYLGISPCPVTDVYAAMALTGRGLAPTRKELHALQGRHLLAESSPGRFQLHDITRAYAAYCSMREDPQPDRRDAIGRLLRYYLRTTKKANHTIFARDNHELESSARSGQAMPSMRTQHAARKWLDSEWRSILVAARHAERREWKRECADLAAALAEFLETSGHWPEAVEMHSLGLQACRDLGDDCGAARAAFELSMANLLTGQQETALQHANDSAVLFRRLGDRSGEAAALDRIGTVCYKSARFRDALAHHQESADIYRAIGDLRGMALALCHIGTDYSSLGRFTEAIGVLNQALGLCRRIGDKRGEAKVLNNIGAVQDDQGYYRDAMRNYQESLRIFQQIEGKSNIALLEHNMGRVYHYRGDYEKALPTYRKALATYRSIGDRRDEAYILCDIGFTYHSTGYNDEALAHHEKALSIAKEIGERYACVKALCGIAEARQGSGRHNAALDIFEQALGLAREIESPVLEARALQGMGDTLLHTKGAGSARIYWRQALDIFRQMGVPEAVTLEIRLDALSDSA